MTKSVYSPEWRKAHRLAGENIRMASAASVPHQDAVVVHLWKKMSGAARNHWRYFMRRPMLGTPSTRRAAKALERLRKQGVIR